MPVSNSDPSVKICKFCDESSHCRIWNIKFEKDILNLIKKKFPSWFSPLKNKSKHSIHCSTWFTSAGISNMDQQEKRISPPKAIVDSSPLQSAMDKNRESLKVKLLVRRSANQLVEQGILPPLKTSPAIHEQKKLLERAKTGDLLKSKISQRPARQELERRHILESHEGHIDPSLADKYRMLEKAILVDQLNSKISHRPGPLELIEKNILHANEPIERIVKEGLVPFKVSNDDLAEKNFLSFEDDSQSSEGDLFPHATQIPIPPDVVLSKEPNLVLDPKPKQNFPSAQDSRLFESLPATSTGLINISLVPTNAMLTTTSAPISVATFKIHSSGESTIIPPPPPPPKLITYHVKPVVQTQLKLNTFHPLQMADTPMNLSSIPALVPTHSQNSLNQHVSAFIQKNAPGKEKNRKKCKNKAVSKARAIKFHEYKGPKCNSSSSLSSTASLAASKKLGETNYELIMQQQCLLEYLEGIYKNPHAQAQAIKLENEYQKEANKPVKIEKATESNSQEKIKTFHKPHVTIFPSKPQTQPVSLISIDAASKDMTVTDVAKLSKMKVSELKAYLKRVNLPVSGPKPTLIERLKPYLPLKPLEDCSEDSSNMMSEGNDYYNAPLHSVSSTESEMDNSSKEDDIVAEQQRKIEELQRKLQQSQHELEKMKKVVDVPQPKLIFDPQYQIPNQISTVFLVDVSQSPEHPSKIESKMLLESTPIPDAHQSASKASIAQNLQSPVGMLSEDKDPALSLCNQVDKDVDASISSAIPMAQDLMANQDITDVLEILLKNGEWPEMSEDVKGIDNSFIQNSNDSSSFSNENILSSKHFIGDVLTSQHPFADVLSPMNEDPVSPVLQVTEESIDKILDTVTPSSDNILNGSFSCGFNQANDVDFPMDIEDDSSISLVNTDFNRNVFENSEFSGKPHQNMQSYEQNHFNGLKMENCDNKYSGYLKSAKSNQDDSSMKCPVVKTEFHDGVLLQKPQKNGLIGNFDHNMLFDTLKNNNINNNTVMNEIFAMPQEGKMSSKDDNKSLINNLHLSNNFDMFSTAMDFESIIPYNDLQSHDSLFHMSGFETSINRCDHNNLLFSDDTRMSNSDGMTCEDNLNLLCNL